MSKNSDTTVRGQHFNLNFNVYNGHPTVTVWDQDGSEWKSEGWEDSEESLKGWLTGVNGFSLEQQLEVREAFSVSRR